MLSELVPGDHLSGNRKLILSRIVALRVVTLTFALSFIAFFYFQLDQDLPYGLLVATILIGFLYTAFTQLRLAWNLPISDAELLVHLSVDTLVLIILVSISGRTANPFIYYMLLLVAIASVIFERKISFIFCLVTILAYSSLLYIDMQGHIQHTLDRFQLHLIGMWVNFVGTTSLIWFFTSRLATAVRDRQILLAKAREEALRNEQLVGIGTLATSTVHALRTPLSTIAVMLSDIQSENTDKNLDRDITVLLQQVERCKQTTNRLSALADKPVGGAEYIPALSLIETLKEHYLLSQPGIPPSFTAEAVSSASSIKSHVLLNQALINLIDNAIHAAISRVHVTVTENLADNMLKIEIADDGKGMPLEIAENWGKPFFSTKSGGLGIGIFLANSTIEQFGGKVILVSQGKNARQTILNALIPLSPQLSLDPA